MTYSGRLCEQRIEYPPHVIASSASDEAISGFVGGLSYIREWRVGKLALHFFWKNGG